MEISQPLAELDWIPRPRSLALRRLGIETVEDLLTHFPRRHEDRHQFPEFPREESDFPICLCGEVTKTSLRRFGGWKKIFEATLQESKPNALSEPLVCRWFNLHYVQKMIATLGDVHSYWGIALRTWHAARQIFECVTVRVDWSPIKSHRGNQARSRSGPSHEPFVAGRRGFGQNGGRHCGDPARGRIRFPSRIYGADTNLG